MFVLVFAAFLGLPRPSHGTTRFCAPSCAWIIGGRDLCHADSCGTTICSVGLYGIPGTPRGLSIAPADSGLWILSTGPDEVSRLDRMGGTVSQSIPLSGLVGAATDLAMDDSTMWICTDVSQVFQVSRTGQPVTSFFAVNCTRPVGIALDHVTGALWIADATSNLYRYQKDGTYLGQVSIAGSISGLTGLDFDSGAQVFWVGDGDQNSVVLVDFAGQITRIVPSQCAGLVSVSRASDCAPCQAVGACCSAAGTCVMTSQPVCTDQWLGSGSTCSPNPCQPGACCHLDGACGIIVQAQCTSPNVWHAGYTSCSPNPCPPGACCNPSSDACTLVFQAACTAPNTWNGAGSCNPNPCGQSGAIVGWGFGGHSFTVPAPNTGFTSAAATQNICFGLRTDGSIVAWNWDSNQQWSYPDTNYVAIAASSGAMGLKSDESIVNLFAGEDDLEAVPEPNAWFTAAAPRGGGSGCNLGLKAFGSLVSWPAWGCPGVPEPNTGFVSAAVGSGHSLGLRADGTIVAWGNNSYGQCDVPEPNAGFTSVTAGPYHSLGLKTDGTIVAWGKNDYGQCNIPLPNADFVAIGAGLSHSLGLKRNGSIVAWGSNEWHQCDVPLPNIGFVAVAASDRYSLGLRAFPGACCRSGGTCAVTTELDCRGPDRWVGAGTSCDPTPCVRGACCREVGCFVYTQEACTGHSGMYRGDNTVCEPSPCPPLSLPHPGNCVVTPELDGQGVIIAPGSLNGTTLSITVRDLSNNPIANADVQVFFDSRVRTCTAADRTAQTDDDGNCTISLRGGGCVTGPNACWIVANDIGIRNYWRVRSPDNMSHTESVPDGTVTLVDLVWFAAEFRGMGAVECHDYDGDWICDLRDLAIFGDAFKAALSCELR